MGQKPRITTESILLILPGVYMSSCLSVDRFCQHNRITAIHDTVEELHRCVVDIRIKAEFEDGCCMSKIV